MKVSTAIVMVPFVVLWIACGVYAWKIAEAKGHHQGWWGLGGLLLGPIGVLAAAGLPDLITRKYLRKIAGEEVDHKDIRAYFKE